MSSQLFEESDRTSSKRNLLILAGVFLCFLVLSLFYARVIIQSDGITYYALTRSLYEDGDFDLTNQNRYLPNLHTSMSPGTGKIASRYSCGYTLLYFPFLWLARQVAAVFPSFAGWQPYDQNTFIPFSDSVGIFTGTILFAMASIFIMAHLLHARFQASYGSGMFLALSLFLGTPIAFHAFSSPSFSHTADAFLLTVATYFALNRDFLTPSNSKWKNILLGFFLAWSVVLRNHNVVLIVPMVGCVLFFERQKGWKSSLRTCLEIFAGAVPMILIQAAYNWNQYGKIFATGYRIDFSKEPISKKLDSLSRFYSVLVHPSSGLFFWAPVTALSFVGLILGTVRKRKEAILGLLSILVVILSIRFMRYLWSGASFGQRFLLHLFPFYVIGLYQLFAISKKVTTWIAVLAVLWCFWLMNLYLLVFPYPEFREKLKIKDTVRMTPFLLMGYADKICERGESRDTNFMETWWNSLGRQPYPTLIHLFMPGDNSGKQERDISVRRKKSREIEVE